MSDKVTAIIGTTIIVVLIVAIIFRVPMIKTLVTGIQ